MELNTLNLIAQIIGILAFLFFISSIQFKKGKLLILQLIANFLYGIQYLLLGAKTAGYLNFSSVIRCIIFYYYEKNNKSPSILILLLTITAILIISYLTKTPNLTYLSLIPIFINILYAISSWQNNLLILRIVFLIASIFWFFYNYQIGAYTALIGNTFEFASGLISIIRYKKKHTT